MFWLIFSDVWLMTPLSGQIVLGLSAVALLSYLEILDSVRGVRSLNNAVTSSILDLANTNPNHALLFSFSEIVPLALLATHMYYSTSHQSTFSSIQMEKRIHPLKVAFLPLSVALNTFGSFFLGALAVPLIVLWNLSPLPAPKIISPPSKCTKSRISDIGVWGGVEEAFDGVGAGRVFRGLGA
ncbi:hypothetical protein DFJ58DRAFT_218168 [Suillus subalutaceus]|uniref:uncharacterized protein n=1 Tax=Suillus subalutaceus TaxID=48586 RepID=UPI001B87B0B6|nr:uncharacterized protein DFJ58DRAFT_218168 [Suillus subalutaceus]KAG1834338.1 hypothetical protein DFJ58DRAFT_218168 [Suillus subalutaceus]